MGLNLGSFFLSLSQVSQFRQLYSKVINDKHDDVMAKFGAILAQGILDAGMYCGRNELLGSVTSF